MRSCSAESCRGTGERRTMATCCVERLVVAALVCALCERLASFDQSGSRMLCGTWMRDE